MYKREVNLRRSKSIKSVIKTEFFEPQRFWIKNGLEYNITCGGVLVPNSNFRSN